MSSDLHRSTLRTASKREHALGRREVCPRFIDPGELVFEDNEGDQLQTEDGQVGDEGGDEGLGGAALRTGRVDLRHGLIGELGRECGSVGCVS